MTCNVFKSRVLQIFLHTFVVIHWVCSWYVSIHLCLLGKQLKYSQVRDSAFAFIFWIQMICSLWSTGAGVQPVRCVAGTASSSLGHQQGCGVGFIPLLLGIQMSVFPFFMGFHLNLKAKLDCLFCDTNCCTLSCMYPYPQPREWIFLLVFNKGEDVHEGSDTLLNGNEHRAIEIAAPKAGEGHWVLNTTLSGNPSCGLLRVVPWILSVIPGILMNPHLSEVLTLKAQSYHR